MRGESNRGRDVLHGGHSGHAHTGHATQYLVTDQCKYIWYTHSGWEQLFALRNDPDELHNLAVGKDAEERLKKWCGKMVEFLENRPEGFTDGESLSPGGPYGHFLPDYSPDKIYPFL